MSPSTIPFLSKRRRQKCAEKGVFYCPFEKITPNHISLGERFIEKKEEEKLTNVSFALTPTYVQ